MATTKIMHNGELLRNSEGIIPVTESMVIQLDEGVYYEVERLYLDMREPDPTLIVEVARSDET
jgi:hypothetical protein